MPLVGRMGRMIRSGSSGSFFGTPFGAQQKNSKSRCAKHVLGLKLVFALNIACTVFSIFTCILYFIPKFESFRNEKNVHQIFWYVKKVWYAFQVLVFFLKLSTSNWSDLDFLVGRCRQIAKNRTEVPTVF